MSKFAVPCEIEIASEWWKNRIGYYSNNSDLDAEKLEQFKSNLIELLTKKYQGHWHVHQPLLGSGYRSILFDETCCDYVLSEAARRSEISNFESRLPAESLVMWVDPGSVVLKYLTSNKMKTLYNAETQQKSIKTMMEYPVQKGMQTVSSS